MRLSGLPCDEPTNILYFPFAMRDEYNSVQCGINKKHIKTYYDNVLMEENTTLHFPRFNNADPIQKFMASMGNDQGLGEWKLNTHDDMGCNNIHQCPIEY
jgi:hypothetical protein